MADRNDFDRMESEHDRDRGDWKREEYSGRERGFGGYGGEQGFGGYGGERSERRFSRCSEPSFGNEPTTSVGSSRGSDYSGAGGSYTGGMGTYAEPGRHAARDYKGYQHSDDRIREDIYEYLRQHLDVDASEVEVEVKNGEVTLTGIVEAEEAATDQYKS